MMKVLQRISDFLNTVTKVLGIICLAGMFAVIIANAVMRYVFNTGIIWAYDVLRVLMIALVFFCTCMVYHEQEHVKFVVLYDHYPPMLKRIFQILLNAAGILFFGVLGSEGLKLSISLWETRLASSGISNFWLYIFFSLSMFVLIVHSVRFIFEEVLGKGAKT